MEANGLPSRTSILTAAARAFGSREPDASVRNPDWVADRLIGKAELDLIADHPISKALDQDFQEAMNDPDIFGFAWLMLVRTRFDNLSKVPRIACRKLFLHSRDDEIVPFDMGEKLFAAASEPKECTWFTGCGHNDMPISRPKKYYSRIGEFLAPFGP